MGNLYIHTAIVFGLLTGAAVADDRGRDRDRERGAVENIDKIYPDVMSQTAAKEGRDGRQPVQIFARESLRAGDEITLVRAAGKAHYRIRNNGKVEATHDCPLGWKLQFLDRYGRIIDADTESPVELNKYEGDGGRVPRGAESAWIGFSDETYSDNEGMRWPNTGASGGCQFKLRLSRAPVVEKYAGLLAAVMTKSQSKVLGGGKVGFAPQEIYAGKLEGGLLKLRNYEGISPFRVKNGKIEQKHDCPLGWNVQFVNRRDEVIETWNLNTESAGKGIEVPENAVKAFTGFSDDDYSDNEGRRPVNSGSTQGCKFTFALRPY